ncbi:hypothetical protein J41TS12_12490 [Paenibacillus antibioticophila]|uniref:DUF3221 domain-containing protein n=1 Tax=Paenibacillus antibioticophila TaxID=1274374 RepID=A0A920CG30_9BACL|nr:DUF3221 domain-containing protein [Paenibacillus antibioticophila]GIO36388.1 hypothetical protein J41TS12_12490 [Paenibacillus antibioticophila]
MKRILLLVLLLTIFSGCKISNQTNNQAGYEGEGYILEVAEDRILIVEQKYPDKTWEEIMNDYVGEAIWLRTKTKDLKPGQRIYYRIKGGIDESYPSQADAKEIKIINE